MNLYTKNGRPRQVHGDKVHSRSGQIVGRIKGDKVFGPDGRYVGTLVNDRLVYRSSQSSRASSSFSAANRGGSGKGTAGVLLDCEETSQTYRIDQDRCRHQGVSESLCVSRMVKSLAQHESIFKLDSQLRFGSMP